MTSVEELFSWIRVGQFLSVGIIGAVCDNLVLVGLVELGQLSPYLAKFGSAEAAIGLMFVLNENWTFAGSGRAGFTNRLQRFIRSNVVRAVGAGTALGILYLLYAQFHVWYLLANVAGMGVGFFVNYVFESIVTWRVGHH